MKAIWRDIPKVQWCRTWRILLDGHPLSGALYAYTRGYPCIGESYEIREFNIRELLATSKGVTRSQFLIMMLMPKAHCAQVADRYKEQNKIVRMN